MAKYRRAWSLCGGWAVDAWLSRVTRDHGDVDIAVFQDDLDALYEHLDGWQLIAHDPNVAGNTSEPWNGRLLDLPAHIHARWPETRASVLPDRLDNPAQAGFDLDIQVNERSADIWVLNREPYIGLPLGRCVRPSIWELPTAVPEILLFYKASALNPRDHIDFRALLPRLGDEQRDWFRNAISALGHPWLPHLSP